MRAAGQREQDRECARCYLDSPIGGLEIRGSSDSLLEVRFVQHTAPDSSELPEALHQGRRQLAEYFQGDRQSFDLPLDLKGTAFQVLVWRGLEQIPYAVTVSYRELAACVGRPKAFRAVGQANHRNPIPIIIPCHRVIGSDGSMTGYGSGIWRKQWLLEHEQRIAAADS